MKKLVVAVVVALAGVAFAETSPAMVSLVTPVQFPSSDCNVTGLRLSLIYGQCESFKGIDLGIANRTCGDYTGISLCGANIVEGRMDGGLQIGLINIISAGGWMPVFPIVNGDF